MAGLKLRVSITPPSPKNPDSKEVIKINQAKVVPPVDTTGINGVFHGLDRVGRIGWIAAGRFRICYRFSSLLLLLLLSPPGPRPCQRHRSPRARDQGEHAGQIRLLHRGDRGGGNHGYGHHGHGVYDLCAEQHGLYYVSDGERGQ